MAESLEELTQPPGAMPQSSSSWLDYLFGPTLHQQTGHQQVYGSGADRQAFTAQDWSKYPNYSDIDASKQHDLSYGDPSAGFFSPGAKMDTLSLNQVAQQGNRGKELIGKPQSIDQKHANELHQAWLGTLRSPIAYLGFDPRIATTSPVDTGDLTVDGLYKRSAEKLTAEDNKPHNSIWYNRENHPALVHESVHKGLKTVLESPEWKQQWLFNPFPDEMLTRALMKKHFGDIELGRGGEGDRQSRDYSAAVLTKYPKLLEALEKTAAYLIAKQRPRGPR